MSKQTTTKGKTSRSLPVFIQDTTSTTGGGLSGVTSASSGLVLEYRRQGQSSWTSVTPVAGKTLGTYLSGGIVADGSLAGAYEVDFPDAAFASAAGVEWVACRIRGVTNMFPALIEVQLDAVDYQDGAAFGLSRLDQTISSRASQTSVDTLSSYVDTEVAAIKAKTDNLPSDPADASDIAASFNTVNSNLSTIAGYIDTEVAAIKAKTDLIQAFPANFSLLAISGSGAIGVVDELGPSALSANDLLSDISQAVWNTLTTGTFIDQSFGDRLLISTNNTREVAVNGNGHVAGVLHDAEPNSIPEDAFVTGSISARAIGTDAIDADALADGAITSGVFAADSITASALATDAINEVRDAVAAITPIADLATMIINDGTANARYSVSALQNGPSGAGGSTINVYPVSASTPERVAGTTITYYRDENRAISVVTDFVLDALTLEFVVEDSEGTDLLVIADGSISRSNKTFTVTIGTTITATISNYRWSLRDITSGSNSVIARGVLSVQEAASNG